MLLAHSRHSLSFQTAGQGEDSTLEQSLELEGPIRTGTEGRVARAARRRGVLDS